MKVAFLDRDGTICRDYPDAEWAHIETPELLPGAAGAIRALRERGYEIIILTNQYIIGEGVISEGMYRAFAEKLLAQLADAGVGVLDVFFCPHRRDAGCDCCKPRPGMLRQALAKYPEIDLEHSFFAGDSAVDREFARRTGLEFYDVGPDGEGCICGLAGILEQL